MPDLMASRTTFSAWTFSHADWINSLRSAGGRQPRHRCRRRPSRRGKSGRRRFRWARRNRPRVGDVCCHKCLLLGRKSGTPCSHLAHVADGAVNDGASASPIHRSSREQLSPDAGAHRTLGGSDQDVVGLATVDSKQFLFIRAIVLVGHFAPKGRFATPDQHLVGRVRSERQSWRLPRITEGVKRVTDDGAVERLAHHRERNGEYRWNWTLFGLLAWSDALTNTIPLLLGCGFPEAGHNG